MNSYNTIISHFYKKVNMCCVALLHDSLLSRELRDVICSNLYRRYI